MRTIYSAAFALLLLSFYSCEQLTKNKNTKYKIEGFLSQTNNASIVLSDSTGSILQQAEIKNNQFTLSGEPQYDVVFIHFKDGEKTPVYLDTLTYEVRTWDNNPERLLVTSEHPKQIAYNAYQRELANLDRKLLVLCPSLHDVDEFKKKEFLDDFLAIKKKRNEMSSEFIEANKNSFVGLFELKRAMPFLDKQYSRSLFVSIDTLLQAQTIGLEMAQLLKEEVKDTIKQEDTTTKENVKKATKPKAQPAPPKPKKPERFPAPPFNGLSPKGYLIDLQTIVGQNKIVMLDFWGTWCEPCRMQNPFWARLYRKYKDKGFEIISVAEETEESLPFLETAIIEDAMNWRHIVDQNYEIAELYGAYSLPHAVLIDHEGKIIYHKATARDVQEYLQEFFSKP